MGVHRFEDLRVWQAARELSEAIGRLAAAERFCRDTALRQQLSAAVVSTMANIAEGFVRGGRKEFSRFVRIARGSNAEVRALLYVCRDRGYLSETELRDLLAQNDSVGRMLRVLETRLNA